MTFVETLHKLLQLEYARFTLEFFPKKENELSRLSRCFLAVEKFRGEILDRDQIVEIFQSAKKVADYDLTDIFGQEASEESVISLVMDVLEDFRTGFSREVVQFDNMCTYDRVILYTESPKKKGQTRYPILSENKRRSDIRNAFERVFDSSRSAEKIKEAMNKQILVHSDIWLEKLLIF